MYLIVGVDPGTTTGIAAVNLEGKVRDIFSARDVGLDRAVKHIASIGRPSLIASDVTPTPDFVLKIASSMGCAVFTLYEPLSVMEKNQLTSGYKIEDLHSRDALAAALNAYNKYKNKLKKITSLGHGDRVKHMVLQGVSLENALNEISYEKKAKAAEPASRKTTPRKNTSELQALERQNILLKEQIKLKDFEISVLSKKIRQQPKKQDERHHTPLKISQQEQVIDSLTYRAKMLEKKLEDAERMKSLWKKLASGSIKAVGTYPETYHGITMLPYRITQQEIEQKMKDTKLVLTDDAKNRQLLEKNNIPSADTSRLREQHGLHYVTAEDLQRMLHPKIKSLERIIDEYRAQQTKNA